MAVPAAPAPVPSGAAEESARGRRGAALRLLKLGFAIGLLLLSLHLAGLTDPQGRQELWVMLRTANPGLVLLAFVFIPVIELVNSTKWLCLCRDAGFSVSLSKLFAYNMISQFFSLILPGSVGGDVMRVHLLARGTGRYPEAAAVVSIERITGLLVLIALTVLCAAWLSITRDLGWIPLGAAAAAVISVVGVTAFVRVDLASWARAYEARSRGWLARVLGIAASLLDAMAGMSRRPRTMAIAFLNSLVFYGFAVANGWIGVRVFDPDASLAGVALAVPLIMFLMNIPVSIGGIGVMELAHVFVLGAVGIDPAVALSAAVLLRFKSLTAAAAGWIFYTVDQTSGRQSAEQLAAAARSAAEHAASPAA
jgi:glycosyltransferase 2 family protein